MQTRIIYVEQSEKSVKAATALKEKMLDYFKNVELSAGVWKDDVDISKHKLLPYFGGQHGSEGRLDIAAEVATFLSHKQCWEECAKGFENMLILEDDAAFLNDPDMTAIEMFHGHVLNLGIPNWGTPNGRQKKSIIKRRELKRRLDCNYDHNVMNITNDKCDCDNINLFGAHAYILSPAGAKLLLADVKNGIRPADVFIRQEIVTIYDLFPLIANQSTYIGEYFSNIVKDYNV